MGRKKFIKKCLDSVLLEAGEKTKNSDLAWSCLSAALLNDTNFGCFVWLKITTKILVTNPSKGEKDRTTNYE